MLTAENNSFEISDEDLNVNKYAISGLAGDDYIRAGNLDDTVDGETVVTFYLVCR